MALNLCNNPSGPRHHTLPRLAVGALILWMVGLAGARGAAVSARLDRNTVRVGESVTLTISVTDGQSDIRPALPEIPNVRLGPVGQQVQVTRANGRYLQVQTYTYTLIPLKAGNVVIPAVPINVGNGAQSTRPLALKVQPPLATNPTNQLQHAFLRLNIKQTEVFVGEAFPVEILLYWRDAENIRTPQLAADGFSIADSQNPNYTQTKTRVGNLVYNLIVFRMAATAARVGDLSLGPATCDLVLRMPIRGRRDFFFGQAIQRKQATLTSEPVKMKVMPLPDEGVPETFTGAVGRYSLNVMASPTNVAVGDPVTIRARITGQGQLASLQLPEQTWRGFKLYKPTATIAQSDKLGLSGSKTFEQVAIPQNHEITELPSLLFTYFDSGRRRYVTLSNAPIALGVGHARQAGTPLPSLTNNLDNVGPGADDIIHIKPRLEGLVAMQVPVVQRPWFLMVQAIPVVAWIGLVLRRRWADALANDPKRQRQRRVSREVRDMVSSLGPLAAEQNSDEFFATLFRALQEQIGERLDLPASAITEAVVEEHLRKGGMASATIDAIEELFTICNQARFAPQVSREELAGLIPKLESVLNELQQFKA